MSLLDDRPAVLAGWVPEPAPRVMSPAKLAAWVDAELDRSDQLLFTITPREELEEMARYQRIQDQGWCGQVRAIVAAHSRASADSREFAADEVALAINASPTAGARLVLQALALAALPGLLESVETGMLTQRHALAVLRALDTMSLPVETRCAIVLIALARYAGETPGELGKMVAKLILTVDLEAAKNRQETADRLRSVSSYPDVDGQGVVYGRGPLHQVAAIKASLKRWLVDHPKEPDDLRTEREREWDLFVSLLTGGCEAGGWQAALIVPFSTGVGGDLELAEIPGLGPILPSTARELLQQAGSLTQVAVDEQGSVIAVSDPIRPPAPSKQEASGPAVASRTATDPAGGQAGDPNGDDEGEEPGPGTAGPGPSMPGGGPVPSAFHAPEPREPLDDEWLSAVRLLMSSPPPERLRPEQLDSVAYTTPGRLRRLLQARDRTCVFPGCHRRITDIDHRIPWPLGPTAHWNLQLLCRHHHRAKQAVFTVELTPDGDYLWTTRGGQQFLRRSQGY